MNDARTYHTQCAHAWATLWTGDQQCVFCGRLQSRVRLAEALVYVPLPYFSATKKPRGLDRGANAF